MVKHLPLLHTQTDDTPTPDLSVSQGSTLRLPLSEGQVGTPSEFEEQ
jgi:hypothetical protein